MKQVLKKLVIQVLTLEAKLVLKKYQPTIVAVTGSVGKTGTKDAIFALLSKEIFTRKSDKSYNTEFGVPLTILNRPTGWDNPFSWLRTILEGIFLIVITQKYPRYLILEVGADRPGDIASVAPWLRPDVVVVTSMGTTPVHVEFFPSIEAVAREKSFLVRALNPEGFAVLNADDERVMEMASLSKAKIITYGFGENAKMRATKIDNIYKKVGRRKMPSGLNFFVGFGEEQSHVEIGGVLGKGQIYAILAALAVGKSRDLDILYMVGLLKDYKTPPGRLRLIPGIKDSLIIDDTYNSSPAAAELALKTLGGIETSGRKIAVLGDMLELGIYTKGEHEALGLLATDVVDELFVVGQRAKFIAESAKSAGLSDDHVYVFGDSRECGRYLQNFIKEGDIILVKGSQSIRLEKVIEEIMAEPERKQELLVRQDPEWQRR